jgi:MFS family permease
VFRPSTSIRIDDAHRPRSGDGLRGDLRAGIGDGATFSVMVGLGETYLPAFALAAGLGEVASGLVATIPLLIGATLQLAAPWGVRRCGSNRRWVLVFAACQGLAFLPLVMAAHFRVVTPGLVFASAAMYWGCGLATGPAWNTWIGTLVPERLRANYFARRTRFGQVGLLAGFTCGGIALQVGTRYGAALDVFAMLFLTATLFRLVSIYFLSSQRELTQPTLPEFSPTTWPRARSPHSTARGLLLYFLAVQVAVQISGPYFNPYMLQHLHFSYAQYVLLVGAAYISRIVALPALGRVAHRYGARRLLWVGGIGIAPLSAAWLISDNFWYLVALQLVVGVFWGSYELSTVLLFFEAIPERERTGVLTRFNFANALATFIGSMIGGLSLIGFGKLKVTYLTLFVVSSLARCVALAVLWRVSPASVPERAPVVPLPSMRPPTHGPAYVPSGGPADQGIAA